MSRERISIDRALLEEYAKDGAMLLFLVNVLLKADRKGGTFSTSIRELAKELGLSVRQVRTCMSKLKERHTIDTLNDTRATQITICECECYEDERHTSDTPSDTRATHRKKNSPSMMVSNGSSPDPTSLTPLLFPQEEMNEEGDADASRKKCGPISIPPPYSLIMKIWNESMTGKVPKIKALSESRKEKVRLRFDEMGGYAEAEKTIRECFKKINESEFCNGENDNRWVASFDWFFSNERNWLKVLEGNYDNRQRKTQLEILAENVAKADAYYEQRYHGYGGASPYGNQTGSGPYGPDEQ